MKEERIAPDFYPNNDIKTFYGSCGWVSGLLLMLNLSERRFRLYTAVMEAETDKIINLATRSILLDKVLNKEGQNAGETDI